MYGIEVIILNVSGALIGHIIGALVDDAQLSSPIPKPIFGTMLTLTSQVFGVLMSSYTFMECQEIYLLTMLKSKFL